MGSKQSLSNGNEVEEVIQLLQGFAQLNQVTIHVSCYARYVDGGFEVEWWAVATNVHQDPVVRKRWDSASVTCSGREWVTLTALYTNLLYRLDFAIGEKEMEAIGVKRA